MKKTIKLKKIIIPIFVLVFLILPTSYSFYFSKYDSSVLSRFILRQNLTTSYVRATVLTYWVDNTSCDDTSDLTTCDITGKSSWNLKNGVVNTDWYLLEDGYYYYKTSVNSKDITKDNISNNSIALINKELSFSELTDEYVTTSGAHPQYEIIYEFIECDSVEDAWNVSYSTNKPVLVP